MHIYIYIERNKERERERETYFPRLARCNLDRRTHKCPIPRKLASTTWRIYIYIYMHGTNCKTMEANACSDRFLMRFFSSHSSWTLPCSRGKTQPATKVRTISFVMAGRKLARLASRMLMPAFATPF